MAEPKELGLSANIVTVEVIIDGDTFTINQADFDPTVHTLVTDVGDADTEVPTPKPKHRR